jgi:biopolymer transport protein ExbB
MRRFAAPGRTRLSTWLIAGLLGLFLVGFVTHFTPTVRAQDGEPKKDEPKKDEPKKDDTKADDKGGGGNMMLYIIKSVGFFFGIILLVISVALVAMIVLLAMDLRFGVAIPPAFVEDFTDTVNKRQFKAAYEMARDDGSFLGRVMSAGMSRLQYGIEDAREAAFNQVEAMKATKDQLLTFLAVIGTVGPLLGLLGTVVGMIQTFQSLGTSEQIKPKELANGIGHALAVTLIGIGLSVPAIMFHGFFKNRLTRLSQDTANMADDLLTQMYHNSKKPAPTAGSSPSVAMDNRPASAPEVRAK